MSGGGGATTTAPGVGGGRFGTTEGQPGVGMVGGAGEMNAAGAAGGGGGGLFGGGGGSDDGDFHAGGGGGGSNLAPADATINATTTQTSDGSVTATYLACPVTSGGSSTVTRSGQGFWVASPNGAVTAVGTAVAYGSMAGRPLDAPIVA